MSENQFSDQGRVGIRLDKSEYEVAPGGNTRVNVILRNQGIENDRFALAIGGIPAVWASASQPVVSLAPGEEKESFLIIKLPPFGEVETGERSLTIRATSQQHPEQFSEAKAVLQINVAVVPSKIETDINTAQFSVAPGSSTTFPVRVKNNGLDADILNLYLDGVPSGWVSTPSPVIELESGEEKEISITIAPPRAPESRAGRHPLTIRLVSQKNSSQITLQEAILTIGAFVQFQSELQPPAPIEALQNAQLTIINEGNIHESFQIDWESSEDKLAFELWQPRGPEEDEMMFKAVQEHALKVEPGKQGLASFRAGLRQRPFIGGTKNYPFQVHVRSSDGDVLTHNSEISDRAIVPVWVIPLILVLCFSITCLGIFVYNWQQKEPPPVAQDDSWARVQSAGVLRVATSADYPPFIYHNQDYIIDGFDAALIREIGGKLGVQVQISDYAFEGLGATLKVGQADVAIAAISVTPAREEQFDFSNIYYVGKDGILARADSNIGSITTPAQMAGKRVGVQQFTVYERWAQDVLVAGGIIAQDQLFVYSEPGHAVDDLRQGRIDLVVMDLQPATLALEEGDLIMVGQGFNPQRLAIALPKGAETLRAEVNQALLELQNEGRVTQLVQTFLGLRPEDIIPPPTPQPTAEITQTPLPTATENPTPPPCVDAMEFVQDLNYDDDDLQNFPVFDPGQAFQKGWRIRNTGSCTWNSAYFVKYSHGNDPAAQMGGQPTAIQGEVPPGATYDLYVNLVSPATPGKYVGYWQMYNSDDKAFGQTIWVAVEVRGPTPIAPTATVTTAPVPTATVAPTQAPTATQAPPEPTEEPGADLRDKTWVLAGFMANLEDDQLADPLPDTEVNLIFNPGGDFDGNGGCNAYSGRYVTNGIQIAFQNISVARSLCTEPAGIMEQEAAYLQLLERAEEYRINPDGQLEIIRYVTENEQRVEKVILLFNDMNEVP